MDNPISTTIVISPSPEQSNFDNKFCIRPQNLNPSNNKDFWPTSWASI